MAWFHHTFLLSTKVHHSIIQGKVDICKRIFPLMFTIAFLNSIFYQDTSYYLKMQRWNLCHLQSLSLTLTALSVLYSEKILYQKRYVFSPHQSRNVVNLCNCVTALCRNRSNFLRTCIASPGDFFSNFTIFGATNNFDRIFLTKFGKIP